MNRFDRFLFGPIGGPWFPRTRSWMRGFGQGFWGFLFVGLLGFALFALLL